jgi:hypothetical protein
LNCGIETLPAGGSSLKGEWLHRFARYSNGSRRRQKGFVLFYGEFDFASRLSPHSLHELLDTHVLSLNAVYMGYELAGLYLRFVRQALDKDILDEHRILELGNADSHLRATR